MKLYFSKGACSLVVRVVLNSLGIDFQDEAVDLSSKKTASGGDYLAINPKGAVPALQLDDGDVLTENQVILQYLADSKPGNSLLPAVGNIQRYHTLEWLNFVSTEIHKTFGVLFYSAYPEAIKTEVTKPLLVKRFAIVNQRLAQKKFLMGDSFTLPDAYLFVMLLWAQGLKIDLSQLTHIAPYLKRLTDLPAVAKSLQQEGL